MYASLIWVLSPELEVMKIFAYNLCLEFVSKGEGQNYEFSLISFADLMGHLFKGMDFDDQVFYVEARHEEVFLQEVFELQTNDIWRGLRVTIKLVFPSSRVKEDFLDDFLDMFKHKDAAGGLVENEKGEYLYIYSRSRWSLPKGGVEWREEVEAAALREVQEEAGLIEVEVLHPLLKTYHTFRRKRYWVLKITHWYKMKASSEEVLVPQKEEGITDINWFSQDQLLEIQKETYPLIREILLSERSIKLQEQISEK